jgi:hypothetical protein
VLIVARVTILIAKANATIEASHWSTHATEGALVDLEDVLEGALDDARSILGTENERDGA